MIAARGLRTGLALGLPMAAGAAGTTTITAGDARFEFLTPGLVRMEYSPAARFVDAPTAVVQKRDWAAWGNEFCTLSELAQRCLPDIDSAAGEGR